jgi:allantoinase
VVLPDLVVRGRRIVTPRGIRPGAIHVRHGRIIGILDIDDAPAGCTVDDAGDDVVLPGVVDPHVQVDAPGQTTPEVFARTTRAAAAGGVTSLIAMPSDTGPPITTTAAFESQCRAAQDRCFVDVGFWGGLVPGNEQAPSALYQAGVFGFACRLASYDEDRSALSVDDLRGLIPALSRIGAPLLVYAELPGPIDRTVPHERWRRRWTDLIPGVSGRHRRYMTYLASRPKAAEAQAISLMIQTCQESRLPIHLAALSSSEALTPIFRARSAGLRLSVDTSPHHLFFVAEDIPNGAIEFTCAPPIRERANREFLWAALAGGLIQSVSSDHRSAVAARSARDFSTSQRGIASIQFSLSVVWTEACARGYTLEQVVLWMCQSPAQFVDLPRKGRIDVGYDADLVVFDAEAEFIVDATKLCDGHRLTPYDGRRLRGVVRRTYLRGMRVYEEGRRCPEARGRFLLTRQRLRV